MEFNFLFSDPMYRHILDTILLLAKPAQFATIAQLNRYTSQAASRLAQTKKHQYTRKVISIRSPYIETYYTLNGRRHGECILRGIQHRNVIRTTRYYNGLKHGLNEYNESDYHERIMWRYDKFDGPSWINTGGTIWLKQYKNDEYHGRMYGWYANGARLAIINYRHGKLHGLTIEWHKDGRLRSKRMYSDGLATPDDEVVELGRIGTVIR